MSNLLIIIVVILALYSFYISLVVARRDREIKRLLRANESLKLELEEKVFINDELNKSSEIRIDISNLSDDDLDRLLNIKKQSRIRF